MLARVRQWLQRPFSMSSPSATTKAGPSHPVHEVAGHGRRSLAWQVPNPGAVAALAASQEALRSRSRDLVRRNVWSDVGIRKFVANAIGTGIKPQSMEANPDLKLTIQNLWNDWSVEADASGLMDFYGLQALACRSMIEAGEVFVRLRPRRLSDGMTVPLQLQILESEFLPHQLNSDVSSGSVPIPAGNVIRAGIEFDAIGRRVAYHFYQSHPQDGLLAPMSGHGGQQTVRVNADEVIHLFLVERPGQLRGVPWLSRSMVKLNELDQYDDAELVRKKTAAMFAGFVTKVSPDDQLMGEGHPDHQGISLASLEPGTLQMLEAGEDIKFSEPADVGASYGEFLRTQFRAIAASIGITYEQLTGDLTGVNYSSIRAGLVEFRRQCEMFQHSVIVFQFCRPIWNAWVKQAVMSGSLDIPDYLSSTTSKRTQLTRVKWVPQGWQWVDPDKEIKALVAAIRSGLISRSEAISSSGYDAEAIDAEIAADNTRADELGLILDCDPRRTAKDGNTTTASSSDQTLTASN